MSIFKTFIKFIIVFFISFASANDLALDLGEYLFEAKSYEEAITEYKRFIFFNPTSRRISYAYYKIGLAYRGEKRLEKSLNALRLSVQTAPNDSVKNEREVALAVMMIAKGDYSAAEFLLLKVVLYTRFSSIKCKASFFRGIAHLYMFKWHEARDAFQLYFATSSEENSKKVASQVDSLFSAAQNLKYKSPSLAKWLSTIIPGLGQLYVGDWQHGLNAAALNGIIGYFLIDRMMAHDFRNAILIFSSLFQRYYFGNRFHAAKMAENYNDRLNSLWTKRILEVLASDEEQCK